MQPNPERPLRKTSLLKLFSSRGKVVGAPTCTAVGNPVAFWLQNRNALAGVQLGTRSTPTTAGRGMVLFRISITKRGTCGGTDINRQLVKLQTLSKLPRIVAQQIRATSTFQEPYFL